MKQKTILMAAMCVLLFGISVFAQSKTDFSGEWTLDVSKSKLDERMRIESGTIKVAQTDKDITYTTDFKRTPRPDGAGGGNGGGGNGGGGMRGGGGMGGSQAMTFTLDGKETSMEVPGPQGSTSTAKLQSEWDGSKLKLTSKRTFNTPNGEMTLTTKETWETVDGGKGLKVVRESESPRGNQTAEFYYAKK
jgi:hypothetical protein